MNLRMQDTYRISDDTENVSRSDMLRYICNLLTRERVRSTQALTYHIRGRSQGEVRSL